MNEAATAETAKNVSPPRDGESPPEASVSEKARELKRTAASRSLELRKAAARRILLEQQQRQHAREKADLLSELADANWAEIRAKLESLHAEAEEYIRENPTKAVLGAAGVGFVLGMLMRR